MPADEIPSSQELVQIHIGFDICSATLPETPLADGHPPKPATEESTVPIPIWRSTTIFERDWPFVSLKCTASFSTGRITAITASSQPSVGHGPLSCHQENFKAAPVMELFCYLCHVWWRTPSTGHTMPHDTYPWTGTDSSFAARVTNKTFFNATSLQLMFDFENNSEADARTATSIISTICNRCSKAFQIRCQQAI